MKKTISIHIGGLHASREAAIIETTLGSCVAVCLYDPLEQIGGNRFQLVAKVFGGAHLLQAISIESGVGKKKAEFVVEFLKIEKIRIIGCDLGGYESRKIYFHTDTGDVFLKRISSATYSKIAQQEKKLMHRIRKQAKKPTRITLF